MSHQDDELPSIDVADLKSVSGGAGMDMSSMLPMALMMRKKQQQAAPVQVAAAPTPAAPARPNILVNGQPAQLDASGHISVDGDDLA
jgi:hypothetical protein